MQDVIDLEKGEGVQTPAPVVENDYDSEGIFRFSNDSDEDFAVLWNNKEYFFPAHTRSAIIIPEESLLNIQNIRKRFAYKWAEREWFKSDDYKRLNALENFRGGRDDKVLEPYVQRCLRPLPLTKRVVNDMPEQEVHTRATKAVGLDDNLNEAFKEETKDGNLKKFGKMPDSPMQ